MRRSQTVLAVVMCLSVMQVFRSRAAAEDNPFEHSEYESKEPWLVTPETSRELTDADQRALDAVSELYNERAARKFKQRHTLVLPTVSSGVPNSYRLLVYGKYIHWVEAADVLCIEVNDNVAQAEWVDHRGVYTGRLPFDEVDELARALSYSFMAVVKESSGERDWVTRGMLYRSHTERVTLELVSSEAEQPLHLRTPAIQPGATEVDDGHRALTDVMHTHVTQRLLHLARMHLTPLSKEAASKYVLEGLRKIPADRVTEQFSREAMPVSHYSRDDLAAVGALLFSHHAVELAIPEAKPELQRLEETEFLPKLEIATSQQPAPLVQAALRQKEIELFRWALRFSVSSSNAASIDAVMQSLHSMEEYVTSYQKDPDWIGEETQIRTNRVFEALEHIAPDHAPTESMKQYFDNSPDSSNKTRAAAFLLKHTEEAKYFDYLMKLTRGGTKAEDNTRKELDDEATYALFDYAVQTGKRKAEARELLRARLGRKPPKHHDYAYGTIELLGELGDERDLPFLKSLIETSSDEVAARAIVAMAKIRPEMALAEAEKRMRGYLEKGGDRNAYYTNVAAFFELIFWLRHRDAAPLLKQLRKTQPETELAVHGGQSDPQPLIDYLEAATVEERLTAALHFTALHGRERTWFIDVRDQLIREGADPARCEMLLPPVHWFSYY